MKKNIEESVKIGQFVKISKKRFLKQIMTDLE